MSKKNLILVLSLSFLFLNGNFVYSEDNEYKVIKSEKVEKKNYIGIFYVKKMFSNLLKSPNDGSVPLLTLECGSSVKVYESNLVKGQDWHSVEKGKMEGFIRKEDLTNENIDCFRFKYPKFYSEIILDEGSKYYWASLFERYVKGETKVKLK